MAVISQIKVSTTTYDLRSIAVKGGGRLSSSAAVMSMNPSTDSRGFSLSWNIYDSTSRTTDANGAPSFDAGVINVPWDWGGYNGQIAIQNTVSGNTRMQIRSATSVDNGENASPRYSPSYGAWREVVTATKATAIGSDSAPVYISNTGQATAISSLALGSGSIWAGTDGNTVAERQVGVRSGSGSLYMYATASTTGNRGLYVPAHGTGAAKAIIQIDTNNSATFNGNASSATSASSLTNFKVTTSTNLWAVDSPTTNAIGYQSGLTKAAWNYQQTDGAIYDQFYSANWIHQIFGDYRTGQISVRGKNNGTWQAWRRILDETNYSGFADSRYLKLSGGTMTGAIQKAGVASSWIKGRDNVLLKSNSVASNGYNPVLSFKTTNGSWETGIYNYSDYYDQMVFTYCTDTNYNANTNNITRQYRLSHDGSAGFYLRSISYGTAAPSGGSTGDMYLQVASATNVKSSIIDIVYPVGSIYMSVNSTSPASLFGGTWSQLKDRFLLACGDTYSNGATGGEATHKLTVAEMPAHTHTGKVYNTDGHYSGSIHETRAWSDTSGTSELQITNSVGGNGAHNNMPPYLAVYIWKRTA